MEKPELEKEFKQIEADMGETLNKVLAAECDLDELFFQMETWKIPLSKLRSETINASLKRGISIDEGLELLRKTIETEKTWFDEISGMCRCSEKEPLNP